MKDKSINEKVSIYIILFLIFILIIVIILYLFGVFEKEKPGADIIIDNSVMYRYSKKKWQQVTNNFEKYNWNKYKVYEEGSLKGKYSVYNYDDKFYVFNENGKTREPVNVVGDSIYIGGKINTDLIKFKQQELSSSDIKYVHKVLDYYKIDRSTQNSYTYRYKVSYDFDNDKKKEDMFIISNLFSDSPVGNSYSFIFIRDDNKTKVIYNKIYGEDKNLEGCYAYLFGIIHVNGTKCVQIITKCSHYSVVVPNEYGLYQYKDNNYELLLYNK